MLQTIIKRDGHVEPFTPSKLNRWGQWAAATLGDAVDWQRVEMFKPYGGIRIEDDVVCTDDAPINLTREAFAAA